ncbi:MAG TPA: VIT1/CCC1 transporter family protein [Blastocatellia bacterium]|nr:VIT1/CCC1 transporter family protein [Blastocatellia bacterium]
MIEHDHSPDAIRERLEGGPLHSYTRDWVYGGIDGSVTTFAVVAGVVGAQLAPGVILIIGMANILADGFSMAASNFLGTKTEHEELSHLEAIEHRHIERDPDGEREEVRQIFERKGFEGDDLIRVVDLITAERGRWVRTMLTEEYGLPQEIRSPWKAAAATFSAFFVCGLVPMVPFILGWPRAFTVSTVLTAIVFFLIGSLKSIWSTVSWRRSGFDTLVVGSIAAALAYLAGVVLKGLSGS